MKSKKQKYYKPEIKVYPADTDNLLQTVSVTPNGNGSGNTPWNGEQEYEGQTTIVGDGSSVAPAKNWGDIWEEESE